MYSVPRPAEKDRFAGIEYLCINEAFTTMGRADRRPNQAAMARHRSLETRGRLSKVCWLSAMLIVCGIIVFTAGDVLMAHTAASAQSGGLHTRSVRITNCTTEDGEINLKIPRGAGAVDFSTCRPLEVSAPGRRASEQDNLGNCQRLTCSSSSGASSAGSSAGVMYDQHPCNDGDDYTLTESKGQIGPRPPKWPMPAESGKWFTSLFQQCTQFEGRKGDCWWRSRSAVPSQRKKATYECTRERRIRKKTGAAKTAYNHAALEAAGETQRTAAIRQAAVHGKTPGELRRAREEAYLEKYGFDRRPTRDGYGNIAAAHEMLKLDHVASMAWQGEYTGAGGTDSPADSNRREAPPHPRATTPQRHNATTPQRHNATTGETASWRASFACTTRSSREGARSTSLTTRRSAATT